MQNRVLSHNSIKKKKKNLVQIFFFKMSKLVLTGLGGVCFFYLMLNRTFFELNAEST